MDKDILQESPFIKIAVLENTIEAQLLSSVLNQYEIPHRLRSYHDTAYNGLFQFQKGWGEIYAPDNVRQQVLDALAELRSQAVDIRDDEPET
jgi:predicted ATPase